MLEQGRNIEGGMERLQRQVCLSLLFLTLRVADTRIFLKPWLVIRGEGLE
jgi:hypothetical protein